MTVPRVFGLPHLSEDAVAAFADGVLSDTAAARARKHCSECTECAQAVRVQRETAMMLRTASSPTMPAGLLDRLTHLPMSAPMPPPHSGLPTTLGADGIPVFVAHNPPSRKRPDGAEEGRDERRDQGSDQQGRNQYRGQDRPQPTNHHRRTLLPVGILAASAAVVAAGTIGSNVTAAPTPTESQQPAAVQPVANTVFSGHPSSLGLIGLDSSVQFLPVHRVLATSPRPERP